MLTPNMHSRPHHPPIQILQTAPLNIRNRRKRRLFARRRHRIPEAMQKPRATPPAEKTLQFAPLERDARVAVHQTRRGLRELEVRECGGDAECGGALVLAFGAVADPEF